MNTATSSFDPLPAPGLRDACSNLVSHLRNLGYTHADHTTCERLLRAFFPYQPTLTEGSPDLAAGAAFLERFVNECRKRLLETNAPRARRCYGQAVEQAITEAETHGETTAIAPRLTELMTQLDADGHNTTQLRLELEALIDALGMKQFYR
jgi:hypothetical protein